MRLAISAVGLVAECKLREMIQKVGKILINLELCDKN
jgi:hypothetical protein